MLKPKYCLLFSLLLWSSLSLKALATTLVLYQQSQIAGNVIAYLNDNFLLINVPKSKLWYLTNQAQESITVFNEVNKLSYSCTYKHFHGSVALRASSYFSKPLQRYNWHINNKLVLINKMPCKLANIKINQNNKSDNLANDFEPLSTLLINKPQPKSPSTILNSDKDIIKEVKCNISNAPKLNSSESYFISLIFGLPNLDNYPISSTMYYKDGKISKFIETTKTTTTNNSLETILPKLKFQTVKTESKVYNLSRENFCINIIDFHEKCNRHYSF